MISSKDFVEALDKGLRVIESFDNRSKQMTLTDVAKRAGLSRAAARRFLLTLADLGYARQDGRKFMLTPKVLVLSRSQFGGNPTFQLAQSLLNVIAMKTMESASAAVLTGSDILVVARALSPRPISFHTAIGTRLPAFCTAMGRMLLSQMPEEVVRELLAATPPHKLSPHTVVDVERILALVRRARELGYVTSIEEFELGLNTIAVAVRPPPGEPSFSLGLSVPAGRMGEPEMIETLLPELTAAAAQLSVSQPG